MGFKQPRVPEFREKESVSEYIRTLVLFLKEFTFATWTASSACSKEIQALKARVDALEGKGE